MKYPSLIFTSLLILLSVESLSTSTTEKLPMLRIGTMDLRPYGWQDIKRVKHGIIFEMNDEIGKRLGVPYVNKILPFKRMLKLLNEGHIDVISAQAHDGALNAGEKLEVQFDINVVAGTKKGSAIETIEEFKGKHLVYHRSASYVELDGLPSRITYVNSYEQALGFLYKNRLADGAVFSEPAYYYWMKDMNLTPKDFGNVVTITEGKKQWVFVRRGLNIELKNRIKKVVNEIYKEEFYTNLLKKYGKD